MLDPLKTYPPRRFQALNPTGLLDEGTHETVAAQSDDRWFSIAIAEFEHVWHEGLVGMQNSLQTLAIGFTVVTALFAAAFINLTPGTPSSIKWYILVWMIPATVCFIDCIWINEIGRMYRAGKFLELCERRFEKLYPCISLNKPALRQLEERFVDGSIIYAPAFWHLWLNSRSKSDPYKPIGSPRLGNIAMSLLVIAVAVISIVYAWQDDSLRAGHSILELWAAAVILLSAAVFLVRRSAKL